MNAMQKPENDGIADDSPVNRMEENLSRQQDLRSLCNTCLHAGNCIYRSSAEEPIYECNEFENAPVINQRFEPLNDTFEEKNELEQVTGRAKGLCANCENRETCMFADTVFGVWHCEEYQ